ncbi:MAG: carboxypeptidase-like regulatory domain-containing protein [Gaiellales bacterium]
MRAWLRRSPRSATGRESEHTTRAARRTRNAEAGFTLIEIVMAMGLFVVVAAAMAQVLTGAIVSSGISKERTIAQQVAQEEIESIRRMAYDDVGIVNGNPPGELQATKTVTVSNLALTVQTSVKYVADPTPTSYATQANYKKVTVTILRARDSKQLTQEVTHVAPPARAPYGGVNLAIVNVQVVDFALNTPVEGATVALGTGPSAPRSDKTDTTGTVTFAALSPNPSASDFYDLSASLSGYEVLKDDLSPSAATHVSLAPGQTFNTAIRIYRPATVNVNLKDTDGSTYAGSASVTISSSRGSEVFSYTGSPLTITEIAGEKVVPGLQYTASATTLSSLTTPSVTQYVPNNYPTDLSSTFNLTMPPGGGINATVLQGGIALAGATVTVTGGPNSTNISATTDANGVASFTGLPVGGGYIVTATSYGQTVSVSDLTVDTTATTDVVLSLEVPGTVIATVTWGGSPVSAASVTLAGGPFGISVSGTSDGNGQVTFVNVPPGAGYTVTAVKGGTSASQSATVASGSTTSVSIAMPTGNIVATVTWGGTAVNGATVTLTGGPLGVNVSGTSNSSGQVTFTNVPAGTGYTVTGTKSGQSDAQSATVPGGSSTSVALALPTGSLTVTVRRSGSNQSGATVTLSGGPMGLTLSGTTSGTGRVTFNNVPVGSGYTVKAYKCSVSNPKSGQNTSVTVNTGANSLTINFSLNTCPL